MPREPFLINPPRRIPARLRRRGLTRRKARTILHHGYVRRGRRRVKITRRQRGLFGAIASGYRLRGRRRRARRNPVGDELVVLGALGALNPRRRRSQARKRRKGVKQMARRIRRSRSRRRRRARAHRNPFRRRSHRRRRRRSSFAFNHPPRRRRRRRAHRARYRRNRSRRRYRRNPAGSAVGSFKLTRPASWLPFVMTAAASGLATGFAPRLWGPNVTPAWAYGTQAAVAVGGAVVLPMFLRPAHGVVWLVVGLGIIVADAVARYLLPMTGLAAYPYQAHAALAGMGQQPYYPPTLSDMGFYPTTSQLDGMGAYEPVPGALAPTELQYGSASRIGAYWK